ncbi:hypothetical protein BD289DRAFT_482656 [Coniella lustricola]|uniref:HMA domain-containing protein n=1 Tax=Coniella lustricola TaxID=2025994 RepID=A0A2T3A873_9PEZI|nr:hypothetical protein BD289DRAFT_482656 [Coniella lustricola]
MADSQTFKYHVAMSCGGCSGAVTRVLTKAKDNGDVDNFNVNLKGQYAEFTTKPSNEDAIFQKISKTGKATHKWDSWAAENPEDAAKAEKEAAEEAAKQE